MTFFFLPFLVVVLPPPPHCVAIVSGIDYRASLKLFLFMDSFPAIVFCGVMRL